MALQAIVAIGRREELGLIDCPAEFRHKGHLAVNQLPLTDKDLTTISQIRGLKKKKDSAVWKSLYQIHKM